MTVLCRTTRELHRRIDGPPTPSGLSRHFFDRSTLVGVEVRVTVAHEAGRRDHLGPARPESAAADIEREPGANRRREERDDDYAALRCGSGGEGVRIAQRANAPERLAETSGPPSAVENNGDVAALFTFTSS